MQAVSDFILVAPLLKTFTGVLEKSAIALPLVAPVEFRHLNLNPGRKTQHSIVAADIAAFSEVRTV